MSRREAIYFEMYASPPLPLTWFRRKIVMDQSTNQSDTKLRAIPTKLWSVLTDD